MFYLHSSILKPNLHLSFGQIETLRQLPALLFGDVVVVEKLFLEFQGLQFGVGLAFLAIDRVAARRRVRQAKARQTRKRTAIDRMRNAPEVAD